MRISLRVFSMFPVKDRTVYVGWDSSCMFLILIFMQENKIWDMDPTIMGISKPYFLFLDVQWIESLVPNPLNPESNGS